MRILDTGNDTPSVSVGSVVDVMAELNTNDGQRILGVMDPWDSTSVECDVLDRSQTILPRPMGLTNKALGGAALGNNPGLVDGSAPYGLYNIGSYVTVWGRVLESGNYQFEYDPFGNQYTIPYMRIDDGSAVTSGNCNPSYGGPYGSQGVAIFGTNTYNNGYTQVNVGEYVSVTGVSSIWKPLGSTDTYRAIWAATDISDYTTESVPSGQAPPYYGAISGTVTVYDMTTDSCAVSVYSTCGIPLTLAITSGGNGIGTASYSWSNVQEYDQNSNTLYYIVSAECNGYKTRTYTGVTPGNTRNIYLTPLRKLYLSTQENGTTIGPCNTASLGISATVVDGNRAGIAYPNPGGTIRFYTSAGSFNPTTLQQTISVNTDAYGDAIATLYGVNWAGNATVAATADLTTPTYTDSAAQTDDPYRCDWQTLPSTDYHRCAVGICQPI